MIADALPSWMEQTLAIEPIVCRVDAAGAQVEVLKWGERGKPVLLLLHGKEAHAGWWRMTAPLLARQFRVIAPSWSGMGRSQWREAYSLSLFTHEILAVLDSEGAGTRAYMVGHSFGGYPALCAARLWPQRFLGVCTIDSPLDPVIGWAGPPPRGIADRVYETPDAAVARFRFSPPDRPVPRPIADMIARSSLRPVEGGWQWHFDPTLWRRFEVDIQPSLHVVPVPIGLVRGAESSLVPDYVWEAMLSAAPADTWHASIPEAGHHVIVDQPLRLAAALARWTAEIL